MDGIGLVLSGGGGKGAYQTGVWKYLREIGLDKEICAVSGTSVGALNAALFVGGTYEKAENLWMNISPAMILGKPKNSIAYAAREWLASTAAIASPLATGPVIPLPYKPVPDLISQIIDYVYNDSFFSRDTMLNLLYEGIDYDKLRQSCIPCHVTCVRLPRIVKTIMHRFPVSPMEKTYVTLNQLGSDKMIQYLLASSAIPIVFQPEIIEGNSYCDGGTPPFGDNIPVQPLYDAGIKTIIVVNLNPDRKNNLQKYKDAKIIEIAPSENLGNFVSGTLDFNAVSARQRMELGYRDSKNKLE